jgi:hypothetical protein
LINTNLYIYLKKDLQDIKIMPKFNFILIGAKLIQKMED